MTDTQKYISLRKRVIRKCFSRLNDMQFEAVAAVNGAVLVLAGAGSGKTTVLVNRIENMIRFGDSYHSEATEGLGEAEALAAEYYLSNGGELPQAFLNNGISPYSILAITFTNKAANELKSRIVAKIGSEGEAVTAGTFHSVCSRILRIDGAAIGFSSHYTIYDTDDQKKLLKEIYREMDLDEKFIPIKSAASAISRAKDMLLSPEEFKSTAGSDERKKIIAAVYSAYDARLKNADAMDFDDLIFNTVRLFEAAPEVLEKYRRRFRYIMVDEYQDTNHAQYVFVSMLAEGAGNLCVVGDDDQSIYRFRGATIKNILEFEDEYPVSRVIRLEQNYRSTSVILDAANAVIANNTARKGKSLWTAGDKGELIDVHTAADERDEAKYVAEKIEDDIRSGGAFSDNAILYRKNSQSRSIENHLARSGIPYRIIGGFRFYDRKEVKDILAYLQLINNHSDDIRLKRIINEPKRGIGEKTVSDAATIASGIGESLFTVMCNASEHYMISGRAAALGRFCELINGLTEAYEGGLTVTELCERVIKESGYEAALIAEGEEGRERLENIRELVNSIRQYELENETPTLSGFLEEVSLISDIDKYDAEADAVVMMTVHSAKGLEFENVYIVGAEEGIFPGTQSIYEGREELEEERRLAYVALTRAKKKLCITNAYTRFEFGQTARNLPSRFIAEIPSELCRVSSKGTAIGSFGATVRFSEGGRSYAGSGTLDRGGYRATALHGAGGSGHTSKGVERSGLGAAQRSVPVSFSAGERIRHKIFGDGLILSAEPMGNDTLLKISFDTVGEKKIMANFAKLEKI